MEKLLCVRHLNIISNLFALMFYSNAEWKFATSFGPIELMATELNTLFYV